MISQVPLDPMHVIDLGVTRKMLSKLSKNKVNEKISQSNKLNISQLLVSLKKSITREFARLPRGLEELSNWKATEFRQFLLYTGVLVLKNNVGADFYDTFLLLHCAIRLLSCPKTFQNNIKVSEDLIRRFVQNFGEVFGPQSVTYNVHSLLHICACVQQHGMLYNFSAYDFENQLQIIKKKDVRKPSDILQQLYTRNFHRDLVKEHKSLGIREKNGVSAVHMLLDGNTAKHLERVFSREVCMEFNVDGLGGKKTLRKYQNMFNVVLAAVHKYSAHAETEITTALQVVKKRQFRAVWYDKQRSDQSKSNQQEACDPSTSTSA